jgi:pimeloyl-[acyl-carrier protein] synthase
MAGSDGGAASSSRAMSSDADVVFARAFSADGRLDLHGNLHWLRAIAPVYRSPQGVWFLSRYDDCLRLLRTQSITLGLNSAALSQDPRWRGGPLYELLSEALLFNDPPKHTRLRQAVQPWFTPRGIARWHGIVQGEVAEALSALCGRETFDLMTGFAEPIVNGVIGKIIGMTAADVAVFVAAHRTITRALGSGASDESIQAGNRAATVALDITRRVIAERRAGPLGDDLVSLLLGSDPSGTLDPAELVSMVDFVFEAGLESSALAIGNAVQALVGHPAELARLRSEPALLRTAVEELLRYDGPVLTGGQPRVSQEALEFDNTRIPPGELVMPIVAAANRDPAQFAQPDEIVLGREPNRHLTFGAGAHHCLGAHLARIEIQSALAALLESFEELEFAGAPVWLEEPAFLRGMASMTVRGRWREATAHA